MPKKAPGRTTPKKAPSASTKTDLEQRFADAGLPAEEVAQEEPQFGGQIQIPAREAQIKVQAINDDALLFTFVADNGMSVNNYTITYDQIMVLLEGMEPWITMDRGPKPDLYVAQKDTTLVGPDGRKLL